MMMWVNRRKGTYVRTEICRELWDHLWGGSPMVTERS